VTWGAGSIK